MSVQLRDVLMGHLGELRHEPTAKRIRAQLGDITVADTTRALLVWEPKRVVPAYAVPEDDLVGELQPAEHDAADSAEAATAGVPLAGRPVYDPRISFSVHTTDGESLLLHVPGSERTVHAFRAADPDLAGYVLLAYDDFDAWFEEDERNLAHPRDPFHRVDIVHSSRSVRAEIGGAVVAESTSTVFLFEPPLPTRYYFPLDDVRTELLAPSDRVTRCAYKGEASYFSVDDEHDVAWTYREPVRDSAEITGRVAFFNERVDLFVDGVQQDQPVTPWSKRD